MKLQRNHLLTRRIRRVLRVFSNGPRSYQHSGVPNIDWNEDLVPKELYPHEDLIAARQERDFGKEEEEMRLHEQQVAERSKGARAAEKRKADAERLRKMGKLLAKRERKLQQEAEEQNMGGKEQQRVQQEAEERQRQEEEEEERKRQEREEEGERKRKEQEERERVRKEEERKRESEDKKRKAKGKQVAPKGQTNMMTALVAVTSDTQAPSTRKRSRKDFKSRATVEDSDDEAQQAGPSTIQAPNTEQTTPHPVSSQPFPCARCQAQKRECVSNGSRRSCQACRSLKKTCTLARKGPSTEGLPAKAPPPPPALNPPPAPLSHQVAQVKRKRSASDSGETGRSKIRKVRIVLPAAAEATSTSGAATSAEGKEASLVSIPKVRLGLPLPSAKQRESRRVTSSTEGEKLSKFLLNILQTGN